MRSICSGSTFHISIQEVHSDEPHQAEFKTQHQILDEWKSISPTATLTTELPVVQTET